MNVNQVKVNDCCSNLFGVKGVLLPPEAGSPPFIREIYFLLSGNKMERKVRASLFNRSFLK